MKYYARVVFSYWHEMEVEADNLEDAKDLAFNNFDIKKAEMGEGEIYDIEVINEEN